MASKRQKSLQKILAIHVRRLRSEADLTQEQLADRCELSRDMISRIERGTISCSLDTVAKLADVLSVPAAVLLGGAPISDNPKSSRERSLQQVFRLLSSVDSKDLPWVERVLRAIIER